MATNQINFEEVELFASLFPEGEVPKFPQSIADLPENMTQRAVIQKALPELWQRLHGGSEANLPADVLLRMHKGELKESDLGALSAAGMEAAAAELEANLREQQIAESLARMAAEQEAREARKEIQDANVEMARLQSIQLQQAMSNQGAF